MRETMKPVRKWEEGEKVLATCEFLSPVLPKILILCLSCLIRYSNNLPVVPSPLFIYLNLLILDLHNL